MGQPTHPGAYNVYPNGNYEQSYSTQHHQQSNSQSTSYCQETSVNGHEQAQAVSYHQQTQTAHHGHPQKHQQEGVPDNFAPSQRGGAQITDSQKPPNASA